MTSPLRVQMDDPVNGLAATSPRFAFGRNWQRYNRFMTETHVNHATECMRDLIGNIHGKSFLDIGCGSGVHSLAALRCGARCVHSFDYDADAVAVTQHLKGSWAADANWNIEVGSVLDADYMKSLGSFDVVYSWGVLHHTGDLWRSLDLVTLLASDLLVVSVYNDQGIESAFWKIIKRRYNRVGSVGQRAIEIFTFLAIWGRHAIANIVRLHPLQTIQTWRNYSDGRGMSPWIDLVDWAGGYPFEVAKPAAIIAFCQKRGFLLERATTCGKGRGCNEFVFRRRAELTGSTPP